MKSIKLFPILCFFSTFSSFAALNPVMDTTQYSVSVGVSRVIYNLNGNGATLRVENKQDYPILVHSRILNEDRKANKNFVVTPPLFRLSPKMENTLQIVKVGGDYPENKESLAWVCVKGIPPKDGDLWAEKNNTNTSHKEIMAFNVQMSVETCIKMFIRPDSLSGTSTDYASRIKWKSDNGTLVAYNDSPFYINLTNIKVNGKEVAPSYIPPMSNKIIKTEGKTVKGMNVRWQAINDYGGNSKEFSIEIQ
ncbi:molecular chaperone [Escherichia coli]